MSSPVPSPTDVFKVGDIVSPVMFGGNCMANPVLPSVSQVLSAPYCLAAGQPQWVNVCQAWASSEQVPPPTFTAAQCQALAHGTASAPCQFQIGSIGFSGCEHIITTSQITKDPACTGSPFFKAAQTTGPTQPCSSTQCRK